MLNINLKSFHFDYKQIIIDEIALEGLEGIGFESLWRRVEKRICSSITDKMKERFWSFIIRSKDIVLYKQPEATEQMEILDRFTIIDDETGHIKDPGQYLDGPYEYCPIEHEFGSCKNYNSRLLLSKELLTKLSYSNLVDEYGDKLVLVASVEERWRALANHVPIIYLYTMSPVHYCILELVGKSRKNGQMTIGTSNITKVIKEPKLLFYNRKHLQDLDLIRVQYVTQILNGRGVNCLLLRLKRFHQPKILSMPKVGKLHNIVDYLLKKPDYCEKINVMINKGLLTPPQSKKLKKTINIFNFKEKLVKEEKKPTGIKRRFICLSTNAEESVSSEEESNEVPLKCEYKVGVNLLRQAYELFMNAGLNGLTQVQLSQLLGIEFYTSRTICRMFRSKHLVREFLEDKGRQRTARFIAVASTAKIDKTYEDEKKKFLEFINENKSSERNSSEEAIESPIEAAKRTTGPKIKVEPDEQMEERNEHKFDKIENYVTEIKVLTGFENMKTKQLSGTDNNLSLRQLKFANGLLKVVKEKLCVCGYQSLSNLVASETGEARMDAKCLKAFLQKLVNSGLLKMYKVKWPGFHQRYSNFICAPHIKSTDPIMKAKYKEISIRAASNKKVEIKREVSSTAPVSQLILPKYMKIQKLHEFLVTFAYFKPIKSESHNLPQGFLSVVDIIPEFTIEFVIGNINNANSIGVNEYNLDDLLSLKLKDAPPGLHRILLESKGFHITIRFNLKVLAMMGLIQLIYQSTVQTADHSNCGPNTFLLYVNRHSKFIDTTGTWPRPNADIKNLEKSIHFETFRDVENYWTSVYNISINTKIHLSKRGPKKITPPLRMVNEVQNFNNGEQLCDGLGPCGFDSSFYMEIPHLWNAIYMKIAKTEKPQKIAIKLPKLENKKLKTKISKKKPKVKIIACEVKPSLRKSRKKQCDANAIKWSKKEDYIIVLCKAALSIMCPVSMPGCITVRNLVAKDLLSHNDPSKTKSVCHRRAVLIEPNSTLQHEQQCIVNEIRQRRIVVEKYEGILKKIKMRYPGHITKYINESRLPMIELVWIMSQISRKKTSDTRIPCVATDIDDFYSKYTINHSTANNLFNYYKDPEHAVLKETIILTTFLSFNNDLLPTIGNVIYSVFKQYPEIDLRIALDQLKKCGAIAVKEKNLNNLLHKFRLEDMVKTTYKISANYQRKWISRLNSEFVVNLANVIDSEIPQQDCKGSSQINCLFFELKANNAIDIVSSTIPIIIDCSGTTIIQEEQLNVIDIETKYKLKSGSLGWKKIGDFQKFSDLYQYVFDYDELFIEISRTAEVNMNNINIIETDDIIITHLKQKGENGSTFGELEKLVDFDKTELIKKLQEMEKENIIKRVGFHDNFIILIECAEKWSAKVDEINLIPSPWLTLNTDINYNIFFKWTSVIMNKVCDNPGCSISYLSETCELLTNRSVQEICVFLKKIECIKLNVIKVKELDLFSDDDYETEIMDYHDYESVNNIVVFPFNNSLTKYAYLRKLMQLRKEIKNEEFEQ